MQCPPAIAEVLLRILHTGLLRVRWCGWQGDAEACAREADHLHNLPSLLSDYSPERLHYYWQVERPGFEDQSASDFKPLWDRLEKLLPSITTNASLAGPIATEPLTPAASPPPRD